VTSGFVRAHSPFWLINSQWKWSHCRFRNHQRNCCHRWCVDSWALATPFDSKIVNENWVVAVLEIITETPPKGDAWIHQRSHPLLTQKKSKNWVDADLKIINETTSNGDEWIRQHTHLYWLWNSHQKLIWCRLRNHQQNCFHRWHVDQKLLIKTKSLPPQKSSTKPLPQVARGFLSKHSPCWLKNSQ